MLKGATMDYEFLPRDEPGKPLMELSPGFTDRLMRRIDNYQRKEKRRRRIAILVSVVVLVAIVAGVYLLYLR
jgi:hypothetical protein